MWETIGLHQCVQRWWRRHRRQTYLDERKHDISFNICQHKMYTSIKSIGFPPAITRIDYGHWYTLRCNMNTQCRGNQTFETFSRTTGQYTVQLFIFYRYWSIKYRKVNVVWCKRSFVYINRSRCQSWHTYSYERKHDIPINSCHHSIEIVKSQWLWFSTFTNIELHDSTVRYNLSKWFEIQAHHRKVSRTTGKVKNKKSCTQKHWAQAVTLLVHFPYLYKTRIIRMAVLM